MGIRVLGLGVLALQLLGCGGSDDCETTCGRVYDECRLEAVTFTGQALSRAQCVEECRKEASPAQLSACVQSKPCEDRVGLQECLASGGNGTGCVNACLQVYQQCRLVLQGPAGSYTEEQCLQACGASARKEQIPGCVDAASCEANAVATCFQ